jgi:hypothetical protein
MAKEAVRLAEDEAGIRKKERRRSPRVKVNLPARWEGDSPQEQASVTSLGVNGCFLLSGGSVEVKEFIRMEITFPDNSQIYPWAEVVEIASEIGFAVRFTSMDDDEHLRLSRFIKQTLESSGSPNPVA